MVKTRQKKIPVATGRVCNFVHRARGGYKLINPAYGGFGFGHIPGPSSSLFRRVLRVRVLRFSAQLTWENTTAQVDRCTVY
jgi:hypothetical protein